MIYFLKGDRGHGKSTYIADMIKADYEKGVRSYLIVPEQETLAAEAHIASTLPPKAQLFTEITNFSRLSNKVFRERGGLRYNYITPSGKRIIMYRAICELRDSLCSYKISQGHEKNCINLFLEAIGELKSYSVSILDLECIIDGMENSGLKNRMSDLILVWRAYEGMLYESYSDPYDDILMLAKKLGECEYFNGVNVYIDSFYGFTTGQLNVVYQIMRSAGNVTIALDCPSDADEDTMQYAKIARTYSSLSSMARRLGKESAVIPFDTDYLHKSEALSYLSKSLWDFSSEPVSSYGAVKLVLAADEFEECEYVAVKIRQLVESGVRYSKIAIVARNCDTYRGILDFTLDKYDIPYSFSSSQSLSRQPLIKMIISAFHSISSYRADDIAAYAKSPYSPLTRQEASDLESYLYRWNIYGRKFKSDDYFTANPDGYISEPTITQMEVLERVNTARDKVIKMLSILEDEFIKGSDASAIARVLYRFLNEHKIKDKLSEEIKTLSREDAYELSQVYGAVMGALSTVSNICGGIVCSPETFISLFSYAISDIKIGTIPSGNDNVIFADASLIRAKNIDYVFVIGANEGEFPAGASEGSFFSDTDKITLESYGIELSSRVDERSDDELLFFKNAVSLASEQAFVTALSSDISSNKKEVSVGFSRIKALFSDITVEDASSLSVFDKIYTQKNAREYYTIAPTELKGAIGELIEECAFLSPSGFTNEGSYISEDGARELFGSTMRLSKSKIETFVKCRFKYYCSYILSLRESSRITFSAMDIGYLVHAVFERFLLKIRNGTLNLLSISDEEIEKEVDILCEEYVNAVCTGSVSSNRMRRYFDRLRGNIYVFVKNVVGEFRSSSFLPEYFELSFTGDGIETPLPLKFKINEGTSAIVSGVADRVDVYRKDNKTYVKIVDYKTGSYSFKLDNIDMGLDIQMLIYLFGLCKMDECKFKEKLLSSTEEIVPAGITYFPMKISKTTAKNELSLLSSTDNDNCSIEEKLTRNGLVINDDIILNSIDNSSDKKYSLNPKSRVSIEGFEEIYKRVESAILRIGSEMLSGNAHAMPLEINNRIPCEYCESYAVCRRRKL